MYEIVVRADTILAEELTPSSRLPTHALFLAYDEIIAEYGLDPGERHISKLVFMVGGVKDQKALMDKFKVAMAQMNITVALEGSQGQGSEQEFREDQHGDSDIEDLRSADDEYAPNAHGKELEVNNPRLGSDRIPEFLPETLEVVAEGQLAEKAEEFYKSYHDPELFAITALRHWHHTAQYFNYLCSESDTTRATGLRVELGEKFDIWRALAVTATQEIPINVPPNAYSQRTEGIAIRTYEILSTKKCLMKWRYATLEEYRKHWQAKQLAERLAKQEQEDSNFTENSQLARLAQRAHRNLVLSRAFTTWSNRVEEENAKAEVATTAYEMSLKAKALGFARNRSTIDTMRALLDSKIGRSAEAPAGEADPPNTKQPESVALAATKPTSGISVPFRPRPSLERPLSSMAIADQLQTRLSAKSQAASIVRPSTVIPVPAAPATLPSEDEGAGTHDPTPPTESGSVVKPTADADTSDDDQPDERTMLARRHILRMRYFGAWESYIIENAAKAKQFGEERQNQRVGQSVTIWRDQAASRQQQGAEQNIEFDEFLSYQRAAEVTSKWRQRARQETHHQVDVLGYYAGRAEYYQRATKALAALKEKTGPAQQRNRLLERYAERTNFYLRATQALAIWRERAQEVSKKRQLQEYYGGRADYYYRTRNTLSAWQHKTKQRRKEKLKEAHLTTRRIVKRGMGERCIVQWRNKLEPSYQRYEIMNETLADVLEDRKWRQAFQVLTVWRRRARERAGASATGDALLKQKAIGQWRDKALLHVDLRTSAREHWEVRTKSRALRSWNLGSLQNANRPEMAINALEKKERKALRQGFEQWYGRTADKLVPVELPDGTYRNVNQVVEDARLQAIENRAQRLLNTWRTAATTAETTARRAPATAAAPDNRGVQAPNDGYAPTPGRPQLWLGSFGRGGTTTPLAPVPNRNRWQARDSTMGRSDFGTRVVGPSTRIRSNKNLRVSWAA